MLFFLRALIISFLISSITPSLATAKSETLTTAGKRAKVVAKAAVYGFGGGLIVGVASQVFKRKTKNIFMFGSLGMYAGILLGVYVISTSSTPSPYEGPDTYEDYGDFSFRSTVKPKAFVFSYADKMREQRKDSGVSLSLVSVKF
ncbi:MAG: hypothetical protein M9962_03095 [Oligoflexia bacterium]|nr:hypothetical protein [Oligoflexia bacterium]